MWKRSQLHQIFYAITLYSSNYVDMDLIYYILKIFIPSQSKKTLSFTYPNKKQVVTRRIKEVITQIHN